WLGHAAGALAELALDGVGLLEVRVRRIEDERLTAGQFVAQEATEPGAPSLRHTGGDVDPFTLLGVVKNIEVLRLQHLEVELLVLDFVAPEVLRGSRRRCCNEYRYDERRYKTSPVNHAAAWCK